METESNIQPLQIKRENQWHPLAFSSLLPPPLPVSSNSFPFSIKVFFLNFKKILFLKRPFCFFPCYKLLELHTFLKQSPATALCMIATYLPCRAPFLFTAAINRGHALRSSLQQPRSSAMICVFIFSGK